MAFLLAQGGSTLYKLNLSTGVATALTLPTGVTLSTTRRPRFAVLNQWIVMTNSPTRNLAIDPEGTVRVLVPYPPAHPPTMAAGSGTGLTGAYQFKVSYIVTNSDGDLLMESALSPPSVAVTLANQNASLTDIARSTDSISARRIYRTLTGGAVYFHLLDHEGNTSEALINNLSDASLELLPALSDTLTSPPGTIAGIRFKYIVEWKSRLWAISDEPNLLDTIFVTETNKVYAWPNTLTAYPTGQDEVGCVALAPRRNQLGILKRNGLWQINASSTSTGVSLANTSIQQITYGKAGCVAPETVVVVNDKAYWLGNDGGYEWTDNGVQNVSEDLVAPWFKTDTYFNRSQFPNAFAKYNELRNQYELHLAAVGSSSIDRWVALNLNNMKWYGPNKTDLFTPTSVEHFTDVNNLPQAFVGASSGVIYTANSTTFLDGDSTAVDLDCYTPFFHADAPDVVHYWDRFSALSKVELAGTLTITPYLGRLDATAGTAISHTLTTGRELLRRIGVGPMFRFRLRHNTANQGVTLYGFEIPFHEVGRR